MRRFDGTYRWFQSIGEAIRDENGKILRWYGMNVDIDDTKRYENELTEARDKLSRTMHLATVGELSASIAHEINQPLAAIVANSQACRHWLDADPPNLKRVSITVDRVLRDCQATSDIVGRVRALYKRADAVRIELDLSQLIDEVLSLVRERLRLCGIKVTVAISTDLSRTYVDRVQIQQLLMNLVLNAIDAMSGVDQLHELTVGTDESAGFVRVFVSDTGHGIVYP
jgi:C4-dicarboxylate-specific signal transduction histidine kinase